MEYITIKSILEKYDIILLDAFGVLVDDEGALPHAREFITHLNQLEREYFILTNGSKFLPEISAEIYRKKGLPILDRRVISSGSLLKDWVSKENLTNAPAWVLGPQSTFDLVRECGLKPVNFNQDAECLVLANQDGFQFPDDVNTLISQIIKLIRKGTVTKLVCPNPDVVFPLRQGTYGITTGAIAALIEKALFAICSEPSLKFTYLGKPYPPIFEKIKQKFPGKNFCMIGDQLATDILGANSQKIDSILIETGINSVQDIHPSIQPAFILKSLAMNGQ